MSRIDYLRLSLTDRCNMRCFYCMSEKGIKLVDRKELLDFSEIIRLVRIFKSLGTKHVRLTGGEPIVRQGLIDLIRSISNIIDDVSLSTNGILLNDHIAQLKEAGLKRLNISLDTLKKDRFKRITRTEYFDEVIKSIFTARSEGFKDIKLNVVILKNINDDEILDFIEFGLENGLIVRFIEFMKISPFWDNDYFVPIEKIKEICEEKYVIQRSGKVGNGPAEYYSTDKSSLIGFIKTDESNCAVCSRLRLTATGILKICLYEESGLSLKKLLDENLPDSDIAKVIITKIFEKTETNYKNWESTKLYMAEIGG